MSSASEAAKILENVKQSREQALIGNYGDSEVYYDCAIQGVRQLVKQTHDPQAKLKWEEVFNNNVTWLSPPNSFPPFRGLSLPSPPPPSLPFKSLFPFGLPPLQFPPSLLSPLQTSHPPSHTPLQVPSILLYECEKINFSSGTQNAGQRTRLG